MTPTPWSRWDAMDEPPDFVQVEEDQLAQCQGCGAWASIQRLGQPHNCHRNEDGTYEEGGTFQ